MLLHQFYENTLVFDFSWWYPGVYAYVVPPYARYISQVPALLFTYAGHQTIMGGGGV